MLRKIARKFLSTTVGIVIPGCILAGVAVYAGRSAIDSLIHTDVEQHGRAFAKYLTGEAEALQALLTGLSRNTEVENGVRSVATAAGLVNYSIYASDGREVFSARSNRHEWLLRERPGGTVTGASLNTSYVGRGGDWVAVEGVDEAVTSAVLPLDVNGQRLGFLSASFEMQGERASYERIVWAALTALIPAGGVALSIPTVMFLRRRRRIEQADERIEFLANFDHLTKVLNRERMREETDRLLATAKATRERMAVWAIDLEGLSEINKTMGQNVGDDLLRHVSKRLSDAIGRHALLGRLGADDFLVLQRKASDARTLADFADLIRLELERPVEIGTQTIVPRFAMGVAVAPEHGRTYDALARHADLAVGAAKQTKGPYRIFDPSMDEEATRRRNVETLIRSALAQNLFELFYQPIVDLASRRTLAFEALIRLPDGKGNYISPTSFIPIAEQLGVIEAIDEWVIREAIRQVSLWPDDVYVSINLSADQFQDGQLVERVGRALRERNVDGRRLQIEVVESLLLERSDAILAQFQALKELGVRIAMDDFGTGYSSLGYLWRFPFDVLKIDQSFMLALEAGEPNVRHIVETIITIAHHMGMKVTTEGVETEAQVRLLEGAGCDFLQGYWFAKPLPADMIELPVAPRYAYG